MCSSVAASGHGGDLYLYVDLYCKAVENRYINTTGIHMHKYTVCTNTETQTRTPQRIWPCLPPLSWAVESPSLLSYHPLLPPLLALCTDPERMSSPSALMPCCRIKQREKLYYTETGERRRRGTEEAGAGKGSVREKHKWEVKRQILS